MYPARFISIVPGMAARAAPVIIVSVDVVISFVERTLMNLFSIFIFWFNAVYITPKKPFS